MKILEKIIFFGFMLLIPFVVSCSDKKTTSEQKSANKIPKIAIDIVKFSNSNLYAAGWAADPEEGAPVQKVAVFVDDSPVGEAKLSITRNDVADHFRNLEWTNSGWRIQSTISLNKGQHTVYAVAYDKSGASAKSADKQLIVD